MKKTTEDIVNLLPVSDEAKAALQERLKSSNASTRLDVAQTIWDVYDWLYDSTYSKNRDVFMVQVRDGKAELTDETNAEIRVKTEKEMLTLSETHHDDEQIHDIREKIQSLLDKTG